ncbi:MAG: hypothetical protein IJ305_09390 [Oscillospiraceae bacterium]|nr:hypothetical protein [Oscillospiraceae bacterium]
MKRRYVVGICLIVWAICIALSACTKTTYELPSDTSAIEEYIETTSAAVAEEFAETTTEETSVITEAETKAVTETDVTLSEFEKLEKLAKDDYLFYDFTGDDFPELINFYPGVFVEFESFVTCQGYDWEDVIVHNNEIYVCRDENGKNFLVTMYCGSGMSRYTDYYVMRYDFGSDGIKETRLGCADIFTGYSGKLYNSVFTFMGDTSERIGVYSEDDGISVEDMLKKHMLEYVSGYELADVITLDYDNGLVVNCNADDDYAEGFTDTLPALGVDNAENRTWLAIDADEIENGFDFSKLDEYEQLGFVIFDYDTTDTEQKAVIRTGEWCKKITELRINVSDYDTSVDFSAFENVETIIIDGNKIDKSELEFLADMPSIKMVYTYFTTEHAETFDPIFALSNLEAIIDSGHGSATEFLNDEDCTAVLGRFDEYFWATVK